MRPHRAFATVLAHELRHCRAEVDLERIVVELTKTFVDICFNILNENEKIRFIVLNIEKLFTMISHYTCKLNVFIF